MAWPGWNSVTEESGVEILYRPNPDPPPLTAPTLAHCRRLRPGRPRGRTAVRLPTGRLRRRRDAALRLLVHTARGVGYNLRQPAHHRRSGYLTPQGSQLSATRPAALQAKV